MIATGQNSGRHQPVRPPRTAKSRIGPVVALSMATGLIVAVVLMAVPFIPPTQDVLTGVMLLGFSLGWALLAVLTARFTDQPQRWAAAPAAFLALASLVSLSGLDAVQAVFGWIWPPVLFGLVVWMFLRIRRQLRSRAGRWLLYPVLAVLMVASVGGGHQTVRKWLDARAYPMPGQLIDIGGHRLHLHCTGSGSPTVVLEPGGGGSSSDFVWIAPTVARDTTVCVYDRAGRGWSDASDGPQDGARIAADLHTLLDRAKVRGPYVLAGHSFGGLYIQSFAAQFPEQVAGMVLLDSTAPKYGPIPPTDTSSSDVIDRVSALLPAVVQEYAVASTSMHQASSLTTLNGKPLIVLTADERITDDQWQAKQDRMATLSTNSLHSHAEATHASLIDDEGDSAAASQAIRDVVASVRTGKQLA
jgi:pimeloyl-ACP methyl ester carboxylesterase